MSLRFCFCCLSSHHRLKQQRKHTNIIQTSYSLYYIYGYTQTAEQNMYNPRVYLDFSEKHSICNSKLMNLIIYFSAIRDTRFLSINVCHWDFVSAVKVYTIVQNSRENIRTSYERHILHIIFTIIIKQQNKTFMFIAFSVASFCS